MQPVDDYKSEINAAKQIRLAGWRLVCWMVICAMIIRPLGHSGRLDLALPILNSIAVIGVVVALNWKMRRRVWFWIAITIIAALHVPLIMFIPWT